MQSARDARDRDDSQHRTLQRQLQLQLQESVKSINVRNEAEVDAMRQHWARVQLDLGEEPKLHIHGRSSMPKYPNSKTPHRPQNTPRIGPCPAPHPINAPEHASNRPWPCTCLDLPVDLPSSWTMTDRNDECGDSPRPRHLHMCIYTSVPGQTTSPIRRPYTHVQSGTGMSYKVCRMRRLPPPAYPIPGF